MPDMRMQLILEALNKTDAAFNALKGHLKDTGAESKDATQKTAGLETSIKSLIGAATGIGSIAALFMMVKTAVGESLSFLGMLETSTLGIASGFLSQGKYIDQTTDKTLSAQESLKAAQQESRGVLEELQVANFQTIATLDQLVRAYQETLPVAISKGFDRRQVKEFTVAVVQAAGAIGISMDMMAEETRSLLSGTINPRTSRVAVALGITNEDIRQNSQNAQQLFDYLMKRLDAYRIAGMESQNTWAGLWSNVKDIAKQAGGMTFQALFEAVKSELKSITDELITIDEKTGKIKWNPGFLEGIETAKKAVTAMIAEVYRLGMLLDKVGGSLTSAQMLLYGPGAALGIKSSTKRFEAAAQANIDYEKRYMSSDKALQDMAMRESGYKPLTQDMQNFAAKRGKSLNIQIVVTPEGQEIRYVKETDLENIKYQQNAPKKSEAEMKEAQASAKARMQLRLETLKNEEKLEMAAIETRKARLEQQYQSAEVDTENYLNRKKELEAEALRYSIANAAKEADAVKKGYWIVIANEDSKADKIKVQAELTKKLGAIKNDVAIKEEKLNQLGIAGATELLRLKQDLAKIDRDSRLKALEEEKTIADKRIQYQEESGTISSTEAVKERYDWELKILEMKRQNLQFDMMAEGDTRKWEKMYSDYLEILEKINSLPERREIDTGLSRIAAEREAYETIKDFAAGYYLFQEEQLNKLAAKMRAAGIAEVDIERWKTDQIKQYTLQRYQFTLEHTDSTTEALIAKFSIMAINQKKATQSFADGMGEIFEGGFETINSVFFDALEGRMNSFSDYMQSFRKIVNQVIADIITQLLKMQTMKMLGFDSSGLTGGGLMGLLGLGGSSGAAAASVPAAEIPGVTVWAAKGQVFYRGNIMPFAKGDAFIASMPTLFQMANGSLGMFGEEDPEAIMPLARGRDGKLGVRGISGGGNNISVLLHMPFTIPFDDKKLVSKLRSEIEGKVPRMVEKVIKDNM